MRLKFILFLFLPLSLLSSSPLSAQAIVVISLDRPWKFHDGDSGAFRQSSFDDSRWGSLRVDRMWEEQGYQGLDGYAWYRARVEIPSSLLKHASLKDSVQVWLKDLEDGSHAVGIFNLSGETAHYNLDLNTVGYHDSVAVRDLWCHRDTGKFRSKYLVTVAAHAVVLLKLHKCLM